MANNTPVTTIISFAEALDKSKTILYDLTVKKIRFIFRSLPQEFRMEFTINKEDSDLVKSMYPNVFDIRTNSFKERFAVLSLVYKECRSEGGGK